MAENDIIVAKEGASGTLSEIALAPSDINAQSITTLDAVSYSTDQTLPATRSSKLVIDNTNASGIIVKLPTGGAGGTLQGDTYILRAGSTFAGPVQIQRAVLVTPLTYVAIATLTTTDDQYSFRAGTSTGTGGWDLVGIDNHTHTLSDITDAGTAAASDTGDFAAASHSHELANLDATGATDGHVLTADGAGGAAFEALPSTALNDLSNVSAAAPSDNDVLVYDNATSTWVAEAPAASGIAETLLDAKGDLIVASADNTAARLAVGTNGHVLTADSGETTGVKWAALPAGGTKTYVVFTPDNNQPPASNYATLDTRNSVACLDFDDATDESAVFVGLIPEGASLGSGLKIRLHWAATTATSGDCVWLAALERMNTDLDSDSFDTAGTVTTACNGTSGIVAVSEITLTNIDSVTAGDGFRLKITRDADSGSDTLSGDVELVVCEVRSAA